MPVKAIFFECRDVGKHFKKSKKHYLWKFELDGRTHIVELFNSQLSGKKKVLVNGLVVCERQKFKGFQYSTNLEKSLLNLVQYGDKYQLRINNQSFDYLYGTKKSQSVFQMDSNQKPNPTGSQRAAGWSDVRKAQHGVKSSGSSQAPGAIDWQQKKKDSFSLAGAFSGLSKGGFGEYFEFAPPSKKPSLPLKSSQPQRAQKKNESGWGDSNDFTFDQYVPAVPSSTSQSRATIAPPATVSSGLAAPARSSQSIAMKQPPKKVVAQPPAPAHVQSAPIPAEPVPAPSQPPPNFLDDDDNMPQSNPMGGGGSGAGNLLDAVTPVLTALSDIDLSATPVLQPENGGVMSQQQNLLSQLYANQPQKPAASQPNLMDFGDNSSSSNPVNTNIGGNLMDFDQPQQQQQKKDDLWGNNALFNIDNICKTQFDNHLLIEDENVKNSSNQTANSAISTVPMSQMSYQAKSVHDFKGNPNLQPAANVMNPIFNQLGAPNPFAGMGMNPMQMMHTNPGMNPMMGGGPTGVNPGNPAMMMNSMMGGGGMPPNMMGSGGNPNFMGNPMNQNPQSFMGQSQPQTQQPNQQNAGGAGFGMIPAAPQPAQSQGQNPFDLF